MMFSVFLSRILGVVREAVLAKMIGAGNEMDAYVSAFLVPDIVNHLLAGGFMSITFIPIFHRHLSREREAAAWRSFSNILTTGTLVLTVLITLSLTFTEEMLGLLGKQISTPEQLAITARMTRIILPAQFFMYWGSLLMAVQFAKKRFFVPALAPLCYNLGIIAGGLLLGPHLGIEGFAWGVLAGAFIGNYVLQVAGAASSGMDFRPRVDIRDRDLRTYVLVSLPLMVGVGMQFSSEALFRIFGSFLSAGSIACLNYATKALWALNGLFGQALGVASFPFLSRLAAENKVDEMNRTAHGVLARMAALVLPTAAVLAVLAPQVVSVLYQRGEFDASSAALTSELFRWYLIGAFAFAANAIVVRCFYALQDTLRPMLLSTAVTAVALPLYWYLAREMGTPGIALAGAATMNLMLIVQFAAWTRRHYSRTGLLHFGIAFIKAAFAAGLGAGVCYAIQRGLTDSDLLSDLPLFWRSLTVLILAGAPALGVSFLALDLMGLLPLRQLIGRFMGALRGRPREVASN